MSKTNYQRACDEIAADAGETQVMRTSHHRLRPEGERGAAMVEYAVLLGGVAIALMISFQFIGGIVETELAAMDNGFGAPPVEQAAAADPVAVLAVSPAPAPAAVVLDAPAPTAAPSTTAPSTAAPAVVTAPAVTDPPGGGSGAISSAVGSCPSGWNLISNTSTKKNGQNVDANGDGLICEKDIPGNGKGNTNKNTNVKDNN